MTTKKNRPDADGAAIEKTPGEGEWFSRLSLAQPSDIVRGSAGDCCILCGKVAENLPLDHGCKPNIDVQAYRAQLSNSERWSQ